MTDEPQEHRERSRPGWRLAFIALFLIPLLYLASPPFVVMMIGWDNLKEIIWIYEPIGYLRTQSQAFDGAFHWYLGMFPEEIWD